MAKENIYPGRLMQSDEEVVAVALNMMVARERREVKVYAHNPKIAHHHCLMAERLEDIQRDLRNGTLTLVRCQDG